MNNQEQEALMRQNPSHPLNRTSTPTGLTMGKDHGIPKGDSGAKPPAFATPPGDLDPFLFWAAALLPALAAFFLYLPSLNDAFLDLDDHQYILDNASLRSLDGSFFRWCFTTFYQGNWIPLAWINLALDYAVGKLHPWVYHLHSLLLHCLDTVLVFFLSLRILEFAFHSPAGGEQAPKASQTHGSGRGDGSKEKTNLPPHSGFLAFTAAFLAALLFGLHPLRVESVAWANEERDVLCAFFYLLSLLLYLHGQAAPPSLKNRFGAASLVCGALALISKPMAVSLPVALLILDVWPLKRFGRKALLEKIPILALALATAVLAPLAQAEAQYMDMNTVLPLDYKAMNAFHSIVLYLWETVLPWGLHPFYPFDLTYAAFTPALMSCAILVLGMGWLCFHWRKSRPWLGAVFLYYVLTLLPVLGILQTGSQAAADRFTYLPCLAPTLLAGAGLSRLLYRNRAAVAGAGLVLAAGLGFLTHQQLAIWRGDIPFFEDINRTYPDVSATYHSILAQSYMAVGRFQDALAESQKAESMTPKDYLPHSATGSILMDLGRDDEAEAEFQESLRINPHYALAHLNLAMLFKKEGKEKEQLQELERAVEDDPRSALACRDLGDFYEDHRQYVKAVEAYRSALGLEPGQMEYILRLGAAYEYERRYDDALAIYEPQVDSHPRDALLLANIAMTYLLKGDRTKALEELGKAETWAPADAEFYRQLGTAYVQAGEKEHGKACLEKAQQLAAAPAGGTPGGQP